MGLIDWLIDWSIDRFKQLQITECYEYSNVTTQMGF